MKKILVFTLLFVMLCSTLPLHALTQDSISHTCSCDGHAHQISMLSDDDMSKIIGGGSSNPPSGGGGGGSSSTPAPTAHVHSWTLTRVDTPSEGTKVSYYVCNGCGASRSETSSSTPAPTPKPTPTPTPKPTPTPVPHTHNWVDVKVDYPSPGVTLRHQKCSCGQTRTVEVVSPTTPPTPTPTPKPTPTPVPHTHSWKLVKVDNPSAGLRLEHYACSCGQTRTEEIIVPIPTPSPTPIPTPTPHAEHNWVLTNVEHPSSGVVVEHYKCSCGQTKTEDHCNHAYILENVVRFSPNFAVYYYSCSYCGDKYQTDDDSCSHVYEYVEDLVPDCTHTDRTLTNTAIVGNGKVMFYYSCKDCNASFTIERNLATPTQDANGNFQINQMDDIGQNPEGKIINTTFNKQANIADQAIGYNEYASEEIAKALFKVDDVGLNIGCTYNQFGEYNTGRKEFHPGSDFSNRLHANAPFYAVSKGIVTRADTSADGAGTISVYDPETNITTLYIHADASCVYPKMVINIGDQLGWQGKKSPDTISEHVHLETREGNVTMGAIPGKVNIDDTRGISVNPYRYIMNGLAGAGLIKTTFDDGSSNEVPAPGTVQIRKLYKCKYCGETKTEEVVSGQ